MKNVCIISFQKYLYKPEVIDQNSRGSAQLMSCSRIDIFNNLTIRIDSNLNSKCERISLGFICLSKFRAAYPPIRTSKPHKNYLTFTS